jgi:hypothetical protein
MKKYRFFKSGTVVVLFMAGSLSCSDKNYKMLTRFDTKGTVLREIYAEANPDFLTGDTTQNPFFTALTSDWQLIYIDTVESLVFPAMYNVKISKEFQSVSDLTKGMQFKEEVRPLVAPEETFEKHFRWFYTSYSYKGKYASIANKRTVPIDKYMTKEEQKLWLQGDFSDCRIMNGMELKDKLDYMETQFFAWWNNQMYEDCFELIRHFNELSGVNRYVSRLETIKDTLFELEFNKSNANSFFNFETKDVCEALDRYYQTKHFSKLFSDNEQAIREHEEKMNKPFELFQIAIEYNLVMPGKIQNSNAGLQNNDTLIWKVNAVRLLSDDYILTATSRTYHIWAFLLTFTVLTAFVAGMLIYYCRWKKLKVENDDCLEL